MASAISIPPNYPCLTVRRSLIALQLHDRRRPVHAVQASVAGGKKRYKGTVKREEALSQMIEKKVAEAIEVCEGDGGEEEVSEGCRVAWDEVEEISQAKADLRRRDGADPLEPFCQGNPESDECVVYDD